MPSPSSTEAAMEIEVSVGVSSFMFPTNTMTVSSVLLESELSVPLGSIRRFLY